MEIIINVLYADETYAVCLKEDNKAVGSIGLTMPMQPHAKASDNEIEIGYRIGVLFWGKGLISEVVKSLQEYAFKKLGSSAIWCGYYDGNEKSKCCQSKHISSYRRRISLANLWEIYEQNILQD